jgi:predicted amidohydrolase YtcJ
MNTRRACGLFTAFWIAAAPARAPAKDLRLTGGRILAGKFATPGLCDAHGHDWLATA